MNVGGKSGAESKWILVLLEENVGRKDTGVHWYGVYKGEHIREYCSSSRALF